MGWCVYFQVEEIKETSEKHYEALNKRISALESRKESGAIEGASDQFNELGSCNGYICPGVFDCCMWYKLQHLKLYYCIFGISMNPEFFSDLMNHDFELCYNSAWPCQCHLLEMNKDQINTLLITICSQMLRLSSIYMLPFAVARLWALVSMYIALLLNVHQFLNEYYSNIGDQSSIQMITYVMSFCAIGIQ